MRYDAKAIGAGSDAAQASLQEAYNKVSALPRIADIPDERPSAEHEPR